MYFMFPQALNLPLMRHKLVFLISKPLISEPYLYPDLLNSPYISIHVPPLTHAPTHETVQHMITHLRVEEGHYQ